MSTSIKISLFSVLVILVSFCSCKTQEKATTSAKKIEFNVIKNNSNSSYKTAKEIKINSTDELNIVWAELFNKYDRKPPIPIFDFEKSMLIAVTAGEKTNGGFKIKVASIIETSKSTVITIAESKPGEGCMTTSVMSYPFELIELQKIEKDITFKRVSTTYDCDK